MLASLARLRCSLEREPEDQTNHNVGAIQFIISIWRLRVYVCKNILYVCICIYIYTYRDPFKSHLVPMGGSVGLGQSGFDAGGRGFAPLESWTTMDEGYVSAGFPPFFCWSEVGEPSFSNFLASNVGCSVTPGKTGDTCWAFW